MSAHTRGIIVSAGNEELILKATAAEVERFAVGAQATVVQDAKRIKATGFTGVFDVTVSAMQTTMFTGPLNNYIPPAQVASALIDHGFLYDRYGRRVAFIEEVSSDVTTPQVEVTTFGDAGKVYVPGLQSISYRIRASGPV